MKKLLISLLVPLLLLSACSMGMTETKPTQQQEDPVMTDPAPTVHPDRERCSVPTESKESLLTYKVIGNRKLKLFFLPPLENVYEKAPIIFMFPGGGLVVCDMMSTYNATYVNELYDLREAGFATVTIDYRVSGSTGEGVTPHEIVSDCMDAMRYISYYSDVLGVDPQKIVTTGHSAGGALSLITAYAPHELFNADSYWPEADFGVVGAFVLAHHGIYYGGNDGPFSGYYSATSPDLSIWPTEELRQLCSVTNYIKDGGVPCMILMGTHDELVAPIGVTHFRSACQEGGVDCEVIWLQNANHAFTSSNGKPVIPSFDSQRSRILEFALSCIG